MKFGSKFGLGEICIYGECIERKGLQSCDILVKVIGVSFDLQNGIAYMCEHINGSSVQRFWASEDSLEGDPDFDQETGSYPHETSAE